MAFHSGSWWMFHVLELQPTWGMLKWRSVKQSAYIMRPHVLIRHPHHPFVNMIILANSRVEIMVFNLLVECAAEWVKWTMRTWWSPAVTTGNMNGFCCYLYLLEQCVLPVCHCFLVQVTHNKYLSISLLNLVEIWPYVSSKNRSLWPGVAVGIISGLRIGSEMENIHPQSSIHYITFSSEKVVSSESEEKYAQIKHHLRGKNSPEEL